MATRVIDIGHGEHVTIDEVGVGSRGLLPVHGFTGGRIDFADHLDAAGPGRLVGWR